MPSHNKMTDHQEFYSNTAAWLNSLKIPKVCPHHEMHNFVKKISEFETCLHNGEKIVFKNINPGDNLEYVLVTNKASVFKYKVGQRYCRCAPDSYVTVDCFNLDIKPYLAIFQYCMNTDDKSFNVSRLTQTLCLMQGTGIANTIIKELLAMNTETMKRNQTICNILTAAQYKLTTYSERMALVLTEAE